MTLVPSFALGLRPKFVSDSSRDVLEQRSLNRHARAIRQLDALLNNNVPLQIKALPNLSTLNTTYIAAAYQWYLDNGQPQVVSLQYFEPNSVAMFNFRDRTLKGQNPTDQDIYELITYAELIVKIMGQTEITYVAPYEEEEEME